MSEIISSQTVSNDIEESWNDFCRSEADGQECTSCEGLTCEDGKYILSDGIPSPTS